MEIRIKMTAYNADTDEPIVHSDQVLFIDEYEIATQAYRLQTQLKANLKNHGTNKGE